MRLNILIPLVLVALFGLMGSIYVVAEGHTAIVLNLGRVARSDIGPGLHFKWPLIESALVFDRRLHVLDATPERYLTSERKDVSVDFFAVGMIEDVRAFYRATGGAGPAAEEIAVMRLAPIIKDSLRNELNSRTLSEGVSGDRSEVIERPLDNINVGAKNNGNRLVDLRIKKIDLHTDSTEIRDASLPRSAPRQQGATRPRPHRAA